MDAATSTLHRPYGLGPRGPNPSHGPHQAAPGPPGTPRSEEQQHHKPFFFIQSSQPYLPMQGLQWPVPVPMSYNPYYGYPGLGYGPPVMPHYQPNPYLEPPGFVVPQTHLHLMDYRRLLNPQYYQTMAYHARRFRYQQNSGPKEMTSSEVQTEPLAAARRTSPSGPRRAPPGPPGELSPALKDGQPPAGRDTGPDRGFVIQTEEVRIECCATPVGLQLLHAREAAGVTRFPRDLVRCGSLLQARGPQDQNQDQKVCPDILLVGEQTPPLDRAGSPEDSNPEPEDTEEMRSDADLSQNFPLKCVRLPFDPSYLDELRKMESTVWSAEEVLTSSPDSFLQSGSEPPHDAEVEPAGPAGHTRDALSGTEMSPLTEDELEDPVPAGEGPGDEMTSDPTSQNTGEPGLPDRALLPDHEDTSFESLPAYLPSSSWLADFDQRPPGTGTGLLDPPARRRKPDLQEKEQARRLKDRFRPRGKPDRLSLSDHECCVRRTDNLLGPYASKPDRLCSRCRARRRCCPSPGPEPEARIGLKRKAAPFQPWNGAVLPTCDACRSHGAARLAKGSHPDLRGPGPGPDTGGDSSGTGPCPRDAKRPLASRQNQHPRHRGPAPRGKLHLCPHGNDENRAVPGSLQDGWRTVTPAVTPTGLGQRWRPAERSWKDVTPRRDDDDDYARNQYRAQHLKKHKKSQLQGTHTQDTMLICT